MANPSKPIQTISAAEKNALEAAGLLILDNRRERPLYFSGRFLAAQDLTADQSYFLSRQAALNRTLGFGVVQGLDIQLGSNPFTVEITPGYGVTPNGEIVAIATKQPFPVRLNRLALIQTLDATFGLVTQPNEPVWSQRGLFILALRPVEYFDNSIALYPTSLTERKTQTTHYGNIVEATAVSLIRYRNTSSDNWDQLQADVAREIFLANVPLDLPADVLPLAMLALNNGTIIWIDTAMVRRELGGRSELGVETVSQALRSAHIQQYQQHLARVEQNFTPAIAATSYFRALPPAGKLPKTAVNPNTFTQTYFPAEMAVELTVVPTDELAVLVTDSLLLPPIDLQAESDELEGISVLIVIPLKRQEIQTFKGQLSQIDNEVRLTRTLRLAAPGLIAKRKPLERLQRLRQPAITPPVVDAQTVIDQRWRERLNQTKELWYVRRRNVAHYADVVGFNVPVGGNDRTGLRQLSHRLDELSLTDTFNQLQSKASLSARADIAALLNTQKFASSDVLTRSMVRQLETQAAIAIPPTQTSDTEAATDETTLATPPMTLDRATVFKVAEQFGDPRLGEGLTRLETTNDALKGSSEVVAALVDSDQVLALDRLARAIPSAELPAFTADLVAAASEGAEATRNFIRHRLEGISQ
ncbi:hypothetical protein ACQ4M4_21845 [Leptolyngbya sp. AN02str]|uniref:hypothetical protein n=1 Tax=Leptolyngbya sp. AN02str TaxID=3423363 RepID=UPI003D316674